MRVHTIYNYLHFDNNFIKSCKEFIVEHDIPISDIREYKLSLLFYFDWFPEPYTNIKDNMFGTITTIPLVLNVPNILTYIHGS